MTYIQLFDTSKLPELGKYKVRNSEEIVELDNIYLNNLGAWYGIRREKSYESAPLTCDFWNNFEPI